MQIRTKLTFYFVMITASLLLVAFVLIFYLYKDSRSTRFNSSLKNRALTAANLYFKLDKLDSNLTKTIYHYKEDLLDFEKISIYNSDFKEVFTSTDKLKFKEMFGNFGEENIKLVNQFQTEANGYIIISLTYFFGSKNYYLVIGAKDSYGLKNYETLKMILIAVFCFILTLLALSGWVFTKRVMKPISDIMNQVDEISPSNLSSRLERLKNKDELSRLVNTFNEMLSRIENAFKVQKTFTSNAAHELKNPLTIITSQLEVSLLNDRTKEEYKNICISVLEDIKSLNEVTNQLFLITRLSDKNVEQELSKIRIDELIWDVRAEYLNQHPDSIIEIDLSGLPKYDDSLYFTLNKVLMKTCLWNLLENGIKFSTDKKIRIVVKIINNKLKILFINKGEKIQKKDIPYLFEPFYRSQKTIGIKGFGIGLSIVKQISDLYFIDVQYLERRDDLIQFELTFP